MCREDDAAPLSGGNEIVEARAPFHVDEVGAEGAGAGEHAFALFFRSGELAALPLRTAGDEHRNAAPGERSRDIRVRNGVEAQFDEIGVGGFVAPPAKFGHGRRGHRHAHERFRHKTKKASSTCG